MNTSEYNITISSSMLTQIPHASKPRALLDTINDLQSILRGLKYEHFRCSLIVRAASERMLQALAYRIAEFHDTHSIQCTSATTRYLLRFGCRLSRDPLSQEPDLLWEVLKERLPELKREISKNVS